MEAGNKQAYANQIGLGYFAAVASSVRRVVPFNRGLRDQQTVEEAFMDWRQHAEPRGMHADKRQIMLPLPQDGRIRLRRRHHRSLGETRVPSSLRCCGTSGENL
jgi:hypothetical protein